MATFNQQESIEKNNLNPTSRPNKVSAGLISQCDRTEDFRMMSHVRRLIVTSMFYQDCASAQTEQ